jgi:hypothetical protein
MQMTVRRVVLAIDMHRPELGYAGRVGRHQDHGMALMFRPVLGCLHHHHVDRATRIASTRRPPFLAIKHVVGTIALAAHGDIGGIG